MKVGVRPCQGYDRAVQRTLAYLGRYFLAGLPPVLLFSLGVSSFGAPALTLVLVHLASVRILFPGAFLVNFAGLRWRSSRSWRFHPRRAWHAAVLSVVFIGAGIFIAGLANLTPPEFLVGMNGRQAAWLVHLGGLVVLLSSLALAVVWANPSDGVGGR